MTKRSERRAGKRSRADPRLEAVKVLQEVLARGRSLTDAIEGLDGLDLEARALAQELTYGVLRWYGRLEALTAQSLDRPLRRKDMDLELLLLVGLYQLFHTRIPPYAAINETVRVAEGLRKPWAKGLVNAVMREATRSAQEQERSVDRDPATRVAYPPWLLGQLEVAYPDAWERICTASLERPPMVVRVNRRKIERRAYLRRLARKGLSAHEHPVVKSAIELETAVAVRELPGFSEGLVSVQDAGAQMAASLLDCRGGMRVLDACAAPGGKTGHILESVEEVELLAVDRSRERLGRVRENLDRLGLHARLMEFDVRVASGAWAEGPGFDRILLDAPCSATGVIRRHPDIKWLRRPEDIPVLVADQWRMLEALWPLLKEGGMLLYATCSVLPAENELLIGRFTARYGNCRAGPVAADAGRPRAVGWQFLPGDGNMDGFYYAPLWKKVPSSRDSPGSCRPGS